MTLFTAPFSYADHGHLIVDTTANDGTRTWRNSIDVVWAESDGPPGPTETVVTDFYAWLQGMMRNDCHLSKARLAVWAKGNLPLADQPSYWEETLSLPCASTGGGTCIGGVSTPGTTPPGEICVLLKKNVFGRAFRAGNMFVRNFCQNENITADTAGPPKFTSPQDSTFPPAINTWASTHLASHCEANPLPRYCLVHAQQVSPGVFDVFESQITTPQFARLTTHDIGRG